MSSSTNLANLAFQKTPSLQQISNSPSIRLPSPRPIPDMPSNASLNSGLNTQEHQGSYDEQVSQLNSYSSKKNLDLKTIGKHLINQEDSLKTQGGDITRRLYHQMENVNDAGSIHGGVQDPRRARTRSASFSSYLEETRRGSTASDINIPGEDFTDDEEDEDEVGSTTPSDEYDDVFDEESSLLNHDRRPNLPKQLPKRKNEPQQPKGTASVAKTFFLLFKALVGSGVLFLPRAFYNGGLLFSIITLSLFGALTYFCYIGLIDSKKTLKLSSFGELGYKTYGKPLKYCILVSIILSQVGFVATYILFTSENMIAFLQQFLGTTPDWLNRANLVILQCVLLIPLVLIRNLTKLSMVSLISSLFIVIGLLIIFYFSGINLLDNGIGPNITNFNPNSWTMLIGVAVTSFEGIGLILPIESSMSHPEKFPVVLSISMFFITLIFVSIGTIGYLSFGDQIKSIIILNLPQDNIFVKSILILYSVAVFLSAPLQLFPAIKIGESLIFNRRRSSARKTNDEDDAGRLYRHSGKFNPFVKWLKNGFRSIAVVLICLIAYLNADNIDKFVSFNGCFACIPLVYIYPPMIHLKTATKKTWFTFADYLLIVVGIATVIYSSYQIIFLN